ncbi:MAG: sterol desaturase family protein [Deltaproteobacteria bacterium]|nr:sterol desaturase family protein [Deltaproteobacteria bacterium]
MENSIVKKYFGIRLGTHFREKVFFRVSHPAFHTMIFLPISIFLFVYAYLHSSMSIAWIGLLFFAGIILLYFSDYSLHRFVGHARSKKEFWKKIAHVHMIHHQYPKDVYYMQIPPVISLLLAGVYFSLLLLIFRNLYVVMFISAGFNFFYVFYEWMHYGSHAFKAKSNWFKAMQKHHLAHHYKNPNKYYGVTTRFFDRLFNT